MTAESFQIVDVSEAGAEMSHLHELVVRNFGRVEMVGADGEASVVISKAELDSLERAIEVLSATDGVRELSDIISAMAREAVSG